MRATKILVALMVAMSVVMALSVTAAKQRKTDAVLELKGHAMGAGVGVTLGSGTLTYKGKTYPISVSGLDVADIGMSTITASGKIYSLKSLRDFEGNYAAIEAGATVGGGGSAVTMRNQHGVKVDLTSTNQGAQLSLGAGGVRMSIQK